jgi:hypothetical protein
VSITRLEPIAEVRDEEASHPQACAGDDLQLGSIGEVIEVGAVARYPHYQFRVCPRMKAGIFEHLRVEDVQLHLHPPIAEEALDQTHQYIHSFIAGQGSGVEAKIQGIAVGRESGVDTSY